MFPISKFIGNPRSEIVYILVRSGFLEKITGKEVGINGNEGDMAFDVPFQLSLGLTPDVSGRAVITGSDKDEGHLVNPVMDAFPPEEVPVQ